MLSDDFINIVRFQVVHLITTSFKFFQEKFGNDKCKLSIHWIIDWSQTQDTDRVALFSLSVKKNDIIINYNLLPTIHHNIFILKLSNQWGLSR